MSSSSSSSGYSDEDEAPAAERAPPPAAQLHGLVELAQICSFCATFRKPLRLPSFSRTELQEAILGASNGDTSHVELLAELHFKLAREHPTAKMDKMVQDWEKTLARKLQENWRKDFTENPMRSSVAYRDLTVLERVKILDALCHWKLESCAEIHKHIATAQKENDIDAIKKLRQGEIGTDDNGVSYWYFDDGCWVYAEDKPQWQREERKPSYCVEFASAKRIRLSMNFDPDLDAPALPVQTPLKKIKVSNDEEHKHGKLSPIKTKDEKKDVSELKVKEESNSKESVKVEQPAVPDAVQSAVKEDVSPPTSVTPRKMDISMLCASVSPSTASEDGSVKPDGTSQSSNGEVHESSTAKTNVVSPTVSEKLGAKSPLKDGMVSLDKVEPVETEMNGLCTPTKSPKMEVSSSVGSNADANADQNHARVVAVVGAKKRTIIDDDSSDSTGDSDTPEGPVDKKVKHAKETSPPPKKKRKPSSTEVKPEEDMKMELSEDDLKKETKTVEANIPAGRLNHDSEPAVANSKGGSEPSTKEETTTTLDVTDQQKQADEISKSSVEVSEPKVASPTDPVTAVESFDITCESCKKCYDMRYLDPPLVERPSEEWRCFECLVNDARGWPRRRKITPREPFSPRSGRSSEVGTKKKSSSSKKRSSSSTSKKSKKSSSNTRSSSSSKKKSHSSSSKRKSSSSKSSSRKSSSSSSKKHKKRKSSSSSHHRSSSHHHRRRHSHYHHEDFAKLVNLFRERQQQRDAIEEARMNGELPVILDEGPQGWRVVSSTLDDLQALIQSLSGGSLEQDRLRGRLILIQKEQEKLEEQRRKQQELAWNILPRRQSSRIAIERLKHQTADGEGGDSDEERDETRRPGLRSSRRSSVVDGYDEKQKLAHDRAWRARRRHGMSDDDMDEDDEDEEEDGVPTAGKWIDWSLLKGSPRRLSAVCLALIDRLLKEEAAELFARPVDPELDGCPNYLSVITHPMDLGTIRSRLESSFYQKWEVFKKDVDLVWKNCRTFNSPDTMVVQFADLLSRLFRTMCVAAEKRGVDQMTDMGNEQTKSNGGVDDDDADMSSSAESKAESRSSITKAWTESSASESSGSSNDDSSSGDDSDSEAGGRNRRSTRGGVKNPQTKSRSTRSGRAGSPTNPRSTRSTRSRSAKKRSTSSSEEETSASDDGHVFSPARRSKRPVRGAPSKPVANEASSEVAKVNSATGAEDVPPPPPPPPQLTQKRSKPRLVISDSSSSDDSSDSGDSSSSSSSDSDDSGSEVSPTAAASKRPPAPSSVDGPAPPPPPPPTPPPTAPPSRVSPKSNVKPKPADRSRKAKTPTKKTPAGSGLANSPSLLNSYLSSSSSSSSDLSSGDSESSESADSDDSD